MKIGISLYHTREIHFLLTQDLINLIKNDKENDYFIFCDDPENIRKLFSGSKNISLEKYFQGSKWKKFIYYFILYPGERFTLLRRKSVGDHEFFLEQFRYSNPFIYILGLLFSSTFKVLPGLVKLLRRLTYSSNYYKKYKLDRCLLTQYHSFKEQCFAFNNPDSVKLFFPNSHDSLTISGEFKTHIDKLLAWHINSKDMMYKVHGMEKSRIEYVGNPSHEKMRLRSEKNTSDEKKILIFGSNNFVYNEKEMVQEIKNSSYLNSLGINLRIAPSVGGTGEEWKYRFDSYKKILGEENLYLPSKQWMGGNYKSVNINSSYESNINSHDIFIVSGVSNVAYDVMAKGGVLILMFYSKHAYENQFPWWTCKQREVLDHVINYPGVFLCHNVGEIEETLKKNFPDQRFYSDTPYRKQINSSQLIFDELTMRL